MEGFRSIFADLKDPRTGNARLHDLHEILVMALCPMLCGGEDGSDMALFGQAKEPFLRQFLPLEHGIPSHDTFSRVFRLLDPEQFHACFLVSCATLPRAGRVWWRSTAKPCGAPLTGRREPRRCLWSRPGRPSSASCWGRGRGGGQVPRDHRGPAVAQEA